MVYCTEHEFIGTECPECGPGPWFVYMVECSDGSLYTGLTNDLEAREAAHNAGKGAAYTRSRLPVRLVYNESCASRSDAAKREWKVKKLSRAEKLRLCRGLLAD